MDLDREELFLKKQNELYSYQEETKRTAIIFLISIVSVAILLIGLFWIGVMANKPWLIDLLDYLAILPNLLGVGFCSWMGIRYHIVSLKNEADQEETKEILEKELLRIKQRFEDLGTPIPEPVEIEWFDHKRSRRRITVMNVLLVILNLLMITNTVLGW